MDEQKSECDLVKSFVRGDESAFKCLFEDFYPSLCLYAGHYLKNKEEAADIVQESFIKLLNKCTSFQDLAGIKSFLYIVIRNSCLNTLRNKYSHLPITDEYLSIDNERTDYLIMEEETYRILNQAIKKLPPQMNLVISYSIEGLKNAEIAEKMSLSVNTVNTYKKEAYKKLKVILKDHYYILILISELM